MYIISAIICAVLIIADQASKYMALMHLKPIETVPVIQNIFAFTFVENRGAAFGMFQGARIGFLIVTPLIFITLPAGILVVPLSQIPPPISEVLLIIEPPVIVKACVA